MLVDRLEAKLDRYPPISREALQGIKDFVADTVRTRADRQAHDPRLADGLLPEREGVASIGPCVLVAGWK